jgi:glycosyltransferase involved in cell wall biosynthesis
MIKSKNDKPQSHGVVSIVTPVYNSEKFLPKYFEGILAQDYPDIELILVNDGSTDGSKHIMESKKKVLEESGIEVILMVQSNSGVAAAVKAGLEVATGDFVIWPDSDDFLLPGSVSKRVTKLVDVDADVVISDSYISHDDEEYTADYFKFVPRASNNGYSRVLDLIRRKYPATSAGVMVKRNSLLTFNILENYYISNEGQNNQLFIPLLYHCSWVKLDEPLQIILAHNSSHSRRKRGYRELLIRTRAHRDIFKETLKAMNFVNETDFNKLMLEVERSYRWDFIETLAIQFRLNLPFKILRKLFY